MDFLRNNYMTMEYPTLAKILDRSKSSIQHKIVRLGLKKSEYDHTKKVFNEHYFHNIDTPDKAYWLGFISADGNINQNKEGSLGFKISLQARDSDFLRKFLKCIDAKFDIKIKMHDTRGIKRPMCEVTFRSKIMVTDLLQYIDFRKTYCLRMRNIPCEFMRDYLRGYIDGDGCFYVNYKRKRGDCEIVGYDSGILDDIMDVLSQNGISAKKYRKRENTSKICIAKKDSLIKLHHYLYDGAVIFMDRKFEKSLELVKLAS